jgi:hypothetical protein
MKKNTKKDTKNKGVGVFYIFDTLSITLVVSGLPFGGLVCQRKCRGDVVIVPVRVQDSWCMCLGSVSWDLSIPSGVRLMVVLLIVVWPVVSDMPIYDGLLDMYMFCMLHVLYICE